jgi:hypothetical protein
LFTSRLCPLLACFSLNVDEISNAMQIYAISSTLRYSGRSVARLSFRKTTCINEAVFRWHSTEKHDVE